MYAFLNWQTMILALLLIAIVSLVWGYRIRRPFVASSPVRRGLKRASKRDLVALFALLVAAASVVFRML